MSRICQRTETLVPCKQIDDFNIESDGSIEILLSTVRPEGDVVNWMKLKPVAKYLAMRQFAHHADDVDARMAIGRLDRSGKPKQLFWRVEDTI